MSFSVLFSHPVISCFMIGFFLFFLFNFFRARFHEGVNHRASNVLRFAPSVMTSLGLLGTFWSLIMSLGVLSSGVTNEINMSKISEFMTQLEKVFYFSVMGIGSAIFFMFLNLWVGYKNSKEEREEKVGIMETTHELNLSNNEELQKQSTHLKSLDGNILQLNGSMRDIGNAFDVSILGSVISREISKVLLPPLQNMEQALKESKADTISEMVGQLKNDILVPIKQEIAKTTQTTDLMVQELKSNQEVSRQMMTQLGNTTTQMNAFVNNMQVLVETMVDTVADLKVFQENQNDTLMQFNRNLSVNLDKIKPAIEQGMEKAQEALQDTIGRAGIDMKNVLSVATDNMKTTIENATEGMSNVQTALKGIVSDIGEKQEEQAVSLQKFNDALSVNLDKIKPAIEQGMEKAQDNMVEAIKATTQAMNNAMTSVINDISNKVVNELSGTLMTFNTQMDGHLNRMNTELEATGNRSKELIDSSAVALKKTMGEIDKTLSDLSKNLQDELTAFRNEYQTNLTDFFGKQNEALEKTLGVQRERLQLTADQLGEQFEHMSKTQKEINIKSQELLDNMDTVYNPLLNKMTTVSQNLKDGQKQMAKELNSTVENMHTVNQTLGQMGDELITQFSSAFDLLNKEYINQFNQSNAMLEKSMNQLTTASAALLTSIQANTN